MKMPSSTRTVAPLLLLGVTFVPGLRWLQRNDAPAQEPIRIAIPVQMSAGTVYVARQQGFFQRHQLAVATNEFTLGKQALQSVIDGNADLALVPDVPFMLARATGEQVAVKRP